MASVAIANKPPVLLKRVEKKQKNSTYIITGNRISVIEEILPFRIRFTAIQVPGFSPFNVPAIPLQVIGFSNYIL